MSFIKKSHETPLCLLEDSKQFNDYDYCLPHLLDKEPEYENYFRRAKEEGRYIIMDNSLHELGEAYDWERLIYWINELKPNEFIVPDVWENANLSIANAEKWIHMKDWPEEVMRVAVVQGLGLHDLIRCYESYKLSGYKKIAFPYGLTFYAKYVKHPNVDMAKMLGRISIVTHFHNVKIISQGDKIHLLGCCLPQEFLYYQGFTFVDTIDTSNPIIATIEGTKYKEYGLITKPKTRIDDVMYIEPEKIDYQLLTYNLEYFNKLNKF